MRNKFKPGDLLEISSCSQWHSNKVIGWKKTHNDILLCVLGEENVLGVYIKPYKHYDKGERGTWHEILVKDEIMILNKDQLIKIDFISHIQ